MSGTGTRMDANPTESGDNIGKLSVVMEHGAPRGTEARLTEGLRDTLARYGCHYFQGYLLGHPMPVQELEALLARDPVASI